MIGVSLIDYRSLYKSRVLDQFEPLIHKTLSRLFISQTHVNYQDYFQELRIKLLDIEATFDGDAMGKDRIRFVAYAGQGLKWHLLSILRKNSRQKEVSVEDITTLAEETIMPIESSKAAVLSFLEEIRRRLTLEEYELVLMLCDDTFTIEEIAEYFGIRRQTVYKRRAKIVSKIEDLKYLLLKE